MTSVVGVRFTRAGRIHYLDPNGVELALHDLVIAETPRGLDLGRVVISPRQVVTAETAPPLKRVVRRAVPEDIRQLDFFKAREAAALERCRRRVEAHGLPMKLVGAEYSFDGSRLTFTFVADDRVDFRALVRDLAATFRTRIELRQIGPRDQAKQIKQTLGRCGRELCCSAWLSDFPSTSIRMVKDQNLPVNPSRITGACGRLLCCLSYEHDQYAATKREMPRLGQRLLTPRGEARVTALHVLERQVTVELADGACVRLGLDNLPPAAGANCSTCRHVPRTDTLPEDERQRAAPG